VARDTNLRALSGKVPTIARPTRRQSGPPRLGAAVRLAESVIDAVDWSRVDVLRGTGADLAISLRRFLRAETPERASELWWGVEGSAFAQNTVYGGAVPTVTIMLAAMAQRPPAFLRPWIIEVLRFILSGASEADPSLSARCLESARQGVWLLIAEAEEAVDADYAKAVLEVVTLIDPKLTEILQAGLG